MYFFYNSTHFTIYNKKIQIQISLPIIDILS